MGGKFYASSERDDWMTPPSIIARVQSFREIMLDPCAPSCRSNWFAHSNSNKAGLSINWSMLRGGVVFVNPPYGGRRRQIDAWIQKCAQEAGRGVEIIALVPAATGSLWFNIIWGSASAICFVKGRIGFVNPDTGDCADKATFWSAMPYWGDNVDEFSREFSGLGQVVEMNR